MHSCYLCASFRFNKKNMNGWMLKCQFYSLEKRSKYKWKFMYYFNKRSSIQSRFWFLSLFILFQQRQKTLIMWCVAMYGYDDNAYRIVYMDAILIDYYIYRMSNTLHNRTSHSYFVECGKIRTKHNWMALESQRLKISIIPYSIGKCSIEI